MAKSFHVVFLNVETREWSLGRENSLFTQELVTSWRLKFTGFLLIVMEVCATVIPHGKFLICQIYTDPVDMRKDYQCHMVLLYYWSLKMLVSLRGILLKFICKRTAFFTKFSLETFK